MSDTNNDIARIALIGVGGIGFRHLQSILTLERPFALHIVDTSNKALQNAKNECEMADAKTAERHYMQNLSELPEKLDIAIVATSSLPRLAIVKELMERRNVRFIILEKFLFPNPDDYAVMTELLKNSESKVYVNCVMRVWGVFDQLKPLFENENDLYFGVSGGNWGLGCSSIHMIDLLAYISSSAEGFTFSEDLLDKTVIPSKRDGYIEFTGTLAGRSERCNQILLTSSRSWDAPTVIEIRSENTIAIVHETGIMHISRKSEGWTTTEIPFHVPFQSELTATLINTLLNTGTCNLTSYAESEKLHIPLLNAFMRHMRSLSENEVTSCPIT